MSVKQKRISARRRLLWVGISTLLAAYNIAIGDTIQGVITKWGVGVQGYRVIAVREVVVGYKIGSKPCKASHPSIETLGTVETGPDGSFTVTYNAAQEPPGACSFSAQVYIKMFEGANLVWTSPKKTSTPQVTFNYELGLLLFNSLKGYAKGTTGGLGGELYNVTRTDDSLEPGTLRYALKVLTGPTWIVFDANVFPPNVKKSIYVDTPLNLRDNVTIDGRGSYVSIRKIYNWQDAQWTRVREGVYECDAVSKPSRDMGSIMKIRSAKNIIITHLDFWQKIEGNEPSYAVKDKQCFNDVISIYNTAPDQTTKYFTNIWINQSSFQDCADECIGITRSSSRSRSYITISNNSFKNGYKGIVIGIPDDYSYKTAVSIYQNRFVNMKQRMPRVQDAIAHVFNNVYENWGSYGVGAWDSTRVIVEENVFRAISQKNDPWRRYGTSSSYVWARNNIFAGVSNPSAYETSNYPKSHSEGGPWYYDDRVATSIFKRGYSTAISQLRALSGWQNHPNDVR